VCCSLSLFYSEESGSIGGAWRTAPTRHRLPIFPVDQPPFYCHSTVVTLFNFKLQRGSSIFDQVVFAAIRACLSGEFRAGQAFPSVRALAADLKIHPNTAHRVVQHLVNERWLEVRPGLGTVIADPPKARAGDRQRLLNGEIAQLVVEARRVGASLSDVMRALTNEWSKLDRAREANEA